MSALTIHLVRHAPVHPLRRHTVYGPDANIVDIHDASDPAVTPAEREKLTEQFRELATRLPAHVPVGVTAARRTRQTAEMVRSFQAGPCPAILQLASLTEQHWGDWTDTPHDLLYKNDPAFVSLRSKQAGWADILPPSGQTGWEVESFNQFTRRIRRGMTSLLATPVLQAHGEMVVFCHGGTVRGSLVALFGQAADQAVSKKVNHLSVTTLRHDPAAPQPWQLLKLAQ